MLGPRIVSDLRCSERVPSEASRRPITPDAEDDMFPFMSLGVDALKSAADSLINVCNFASGLLNKAHVPRHLGKPREKLEPSAPIPADSKWAKNIRPGTDATYIQFLRLNKAQFYSLLKRVEAIEGKIRENVEHPSGRHRLLSADARLAMLCYFLAHGK